ncbi:MAG: nucleotidyltransferase family protein [Ferrimicrobium sp.]
MVKREDNSPRQLLGPAQADVASRTHVAQSAISAYSPGLPDTPLGRRLRQHRRSILACASRHGASNVRVFGSTARGEDRPDSDIDLVVDLDKGTGLFALEALRRELSEILDVPVDVAPSDGLRPRIREEIEREAIPI